MYFVLKAALRTLLLPPSSPLILATLGALLLRRRRRLGAVLLTVGLVSMWLFATPIVAEAVWRLAEHYPALDLSKPTNAQAIVIIGGGGQRIFAPEYAGPGGRRYAARTFELRRVSSPAGPDCPYWCQARRPSRS